MDLKKIVLKQKQHHRAESFWQFTNPSDAKKWLNKLMRFENLKIVLL